MFYFLLSLNFIRFLWLIMPMLWFSFERIWEKKIQRFQYCFHRNWHFSPSVFLQTKWIWIVNKCFKWNWHGTYLMVWPVIRRVQISGRQSITKTNFVISFFFLSMWQENNRLVFFDCPKVWCFFLFILLSIVYSNSRRSLNCLIHLHFDFWAKISARKFCAKHMPKI